MAELLFGKASPSGKLPLTFYHNDQLGRMPDFTDYSMQGRTYRFFGEEPLYPFGYGLTYGDVSVSAATLEKTEDGWRIVADVTNAGSVCTQDVVQVYCQNEGSANAPANPRLCAFQRVAVPAGKTVKAVLEVPACRLNVINDAGEAVMEGKPVFHVGMGQPDSRTAALTRHASIRVE